MMRKMNRMLTTLAVAALLAPLCTYADAGDLERTHTSLPKLGQAAPKIVGGGAANQGENRWITSLQFQGQHGCGASLIATRWVLTAAHCVEGENASGVSVWIGGHDLRRPQQGITAQVSQIIVHEGYDGNTLENDIALLELDQDIDASIPRVKLANATVMTNAASDGHLVTASGWGALSEGGPSPDLLHEVRIPVVANQICNRPAAYNGEVADSMLCAGLSTGGKDSCQGDSGGPLWVRFEDQDYQVGVVSWGDGCARPNKYGVYTRVQSFTTWVSDQMAGSGGGGGGPSGSSCAGSCGGNAGDCWCDESCEQYGDCCSDYQQECVGGGGSASCTDTVCGIDPYCCEVEFDQICEDLATQHCTGGSGGSGTGGNGGSGFDCTAAVCAIDAYCCEVEFDDICEDIASQTCG